MTRKYNITVYDTGVGMCDVHRKETLETGEVKWFDVDDERFHYTVEEPRRERYEQMYKQSLREQKLKQLIDG